MPIQNWDLHELTKLGWHHHDIKKMRPILVQHTTILKYKHHLKTEVKP